MSRRGVVATLLLIIAAQLVGGVLFVAVCLEPCADDGPGATCAPFCAVCTGCRQQAIVQVSMTTVAVVASRHFAGTPHVPDPSQFAADIFHVPLLG